MDLTLPSPRIPPLSTCLCFPTLLCLFYNVFNEAARTPVRLNCTARVPFICFFGWIRTVQSIVGARMCLSGGKTIMNSIRAAKRWWNSRNFIFKNPGRDHKVFRRCLCNTVFGFWKMPLKIMLETSAQPYKYCTRRNFNISLGVNIIKL